MTHGLPTRRDFWAAVVVLSLALLGFVLYFCLGGCASTAAQQSQAGAGAAAPPVSFPPATRPAPAVSSADMEQFAATFMVAVVPKIQAAVQTEIKATGLNYESQFGIGAVVVCLACVLVLALVVVLLIVTSHKRALARIGNVSTA